MRVIDFYDKRWIFFGIAIATILIGIIVGFVNGVELDIYFKGGSILKYDYVGDIDANKAADIATNIVNRPVSTQITTELASGAKRLIINISGNYGLDARVQKELDEALKAEFSEADLKLAESSMVEPFFGRKFLRNGIIALLVASFFVVIYVWARFRKIGGLSAGIMALIALTFDIIVVFITHIIFRIPIGDSFVAVALTIIGYSINDTIVVYDRIRENRKLYPKLAIEEVTNLSITQSMTRAINTSAAVFISVALIYILAVVYNIEAVQAFALPMAVGTISGCFSSLCIAENLWVIWNKRKSEA